MGQSYEYEIIRKRISGQPEIDKLSTDYNLPLVEQYEPSSAYVDSMIENAIYLDEEVRLLKEAFRSKDAMAQKLLQLYLLTNRWLKLKQKGIGLDRFFIERNIGEIAVYGMHYLGERLCDELNGSKVSVTCGIDKHISGCYGNVEIITPQDIPKMIKTIVITPITFFSEIKKEISDYTDAELVSLEDVIKNMEDE